MILLALAAAAFTQADVQAVRRTCRIPASWMRLEQVQGARPRLHLRPSRNANYAKVDCMLAAVKRLAEARGEWPDLGFVGNEAPGPEKPE